MSPSAHSLPKILLTVSLAVLGLLAGALAWRLMELRDSGGADVLIELPQPRAIGDFVLQDQAGRPFTLEDFRGRWSVLFFGFTSCPDVCPTSLYQLHQVRTALADRFTPDRLPAIYFISVDPERDTPGKLAAYLAHFDPSFIGLTGDDEQLRALTMQLGIMYHIEPHSAGDADYAVDHSASLLVLDPLGRLHGVLPAPHEAEPLAAAFEALLERG